jgi:hypothetical protein
VWPARYRRGPGYESSTIQLRKKSLGLWRETD